MTQLSTRRVVIVFVLVMCISLTTNVFLLQKIHKQGEPVVTPPTFYQLIDSINENFSYTGYNEILNHSNLFMALPQQANDDTLPKRSKVFVYKGIDKNVVIGNVKKCAVGKHPKSEKHGNTAQFSEVERSGTQENCGGIGLGCRLRLRPLPVLHRRQSQWVARIDPNAVVVDKNIAENDRFDLFSR